MLDIEFTSEEAYKKRLTYFKVIYLISATVSFIYLMRYNFEYKVPDYNWLLVPAWLFLLIAPPLALKFSKNYFRSSLVLSTGSIGVLIYLLYLAGGVYAPGVFWLAAIPLGLGILLGVPGSVAGYFVVISVLIFFWYLKVHSLGPNVVADHGDFGEETLFNLVTFMIFSCFTTHQYILSEERFKKKLMEKNLDVENLLRLLIHDIANTLSSMTYNLIKAKEDQENLEPSFHSLELDKIEKAVEDINDLLAQVRHLKSIKDGKATLPMKPLSIAWVLHDLYENTLDLAQKKGLKFHLNISQERMLVNAEKTILSNIVLLNLLNNAVKFSHAGERIDITAYPHEAHVVIEIQDYGIGIPPHLLTQIFNLNAPTTRTGTHGEKGTGYGMPLVREYLYMMKGSIEVFSQEKKTMDSPQGTRVVVKLPLVKNA